MTYYLMSYEFRVKIALRKKKNDWDTRIVFVVLPYNKIVYIKNSGWSGGRVVRWCWVNF